ncbi:hypothetical protein OSTOST_01680, partial [Ostertagia ostertagi]
MQEDLASVRPADFLQRDMVLTFPEIETIDNDDPPYPQMRVTPCNIASKEIQKRLPTACRLGRDIPTVGDIALVHDIVLPRHEWKMARITATKEGHDGQIREVELQTTKKKKIRRPVNLLGLLETQEAPDKSSSSHIAANKPVTPESRELTNTHRYNLRHRQPRSYVQNNAHTFTTHSSTNLKMSKWFLFYIMILSLFRTTLGNYSTAMQLSCTEE